MASISCRRSATRASRPKRQSCSPTASRSSEPSNLRKHLRARPRERLFHRKAPPLLAKTPQCRWRDEGEEARQRALSGLLPSSRSPVGAAKPRDGICGNEYRGWSFFRHGEHGPDADRCQRKSNLGGVKSQTPVITAVSCGRTLPRTAANRCRRSLVASRCMSMGATQARQTSGCIVVICLASSCMIAASHWPPVLGREALRAPNTRHAA